MPNLVKLLSFLRIRRKLTEKNYLLNRKCMAWARHIFPCKIPHIGGPYLYTFSKNPHEVRRLIKFHIITDLKRCFYNCKHCVYMKKTLQVLKSAPCGFFFLRISFLFAAGPSTLCLQQCHVHQRGLERYQDAL